VRNPFCIAKVLNSFPGVASNDPTDPVLLADYRRIVTGRKPHQAHLCTQLGISDAQYVEWLRLLFMLLMPMAADRPNFFEKMIKSLLENRKMHVAPFVCEYDDPRCLLSDRGFSQPIADGPTRRRCTGRRLRRELEAKAPASAWGVHLQAKPRPPGSRTCQGLRPRRVGRGH
jgi:hypothetical protein